MNLSFAGICGDIIKCRDAHRKDKAIFEHAASMYLLCTIVITNMAKFNNYLDYVNRTFICFLCYQPRNIKKSKI